MIRTIRRIFRLLFRRRPPASLTPEQRAERYIQQGFCVYTAGGWKPHPPRDGDSVVSMHGTAKIGDSVVLHTVIFDGGSVDFGKCGTLVIQPGFSGKIGSVAPYSSSPSSSPTDSESAGAFVSMR